MATHLSKTLLRSSRPDFLILTPACILLGIAAGVAEPVGGDAALAGTGIVLLVLASGVLAHVGVNTLNEWSDFRSGLDLKTQRTPFSGGSGALPEHPEARHAVLALAMAAVAIVVLIGLWLVTHGRLALLPLGLLGLFLMLTYTDLLNRHPWACLLAPGAGFGLVMVPGVAFLLAGGYTGTAWLAALVPFFQVNNLLLLNQYPDIDADAASGRRHLLIAYGERAGASVYALFVLATHLVILLGVLRGAFPLWASLAVLPASLGWVAWVGVRRHGRDVAKAPPYLALNVVASVVTPAVLGASLLLA